MSISSRITALFVHASGESWALGLTLGSLHLMASLWVVLRLASATPTDWWQFGWLPFAIADLPLTLVLFPIAQLFRSATISVLPYPVGEVREFLFPAFTHGVLGPALYLLAPPYLTSRFHGRAHGRARSS
jgi:hypothetical protein